MLGAVFPEDRHIPRVLETIEAYSHLGTTFEILFRGERSRLWSYFPPSWTREGRSTPVEAPSHLQTAHGRNAAGFRMTSNDFRWPSKVFLIFFNGFLKFSKVL